MPAISGTRGELLLTFKGDRPGAFQLDDWLYFRVKPEENPLFWIRSTRKSPPLSSPETLGEIVVAEEGKAYGGIYTTSFTGVTLPGRPSQSSTLAAGSSGRPDKDFAGNYNPDWTAGITNTFQYRNWDFPFLSICCMGGVVISGTQASWRRRLGYEKYAGVGRGTGFIVANSGDSGRGEECCVPVPGAGDYWQWVGSGKPCRRRRLSDSATNIRLRQQATLKLYVAVAAGKILSSKALLFRLLAVQSFFPEERCGPVRSGIGPGNG